MKPNIFVSIILILIPSFSAFSGLLVDFKPSDLSGSKGAECMKVVREMVISSLGNVPPDFKVGTNKRVGELLKSVGMSPAHVKQIEDVLKDIQKADLSHASQVKELLEIEKNIARRLFYCAFSKGCSFDTKDFSTMGFYQLKDNNFSFVDDVKNIAQLPLEKVTPLQGRINSIFLRDTVTDGKQNVSDWVATYYHEFQHFWDFHILDKWIQLNQEKIIAGQNPDPLFSSVVRVSQSGKIFMQADFRSAFLESRAYRAMDQVYRIVSPKAGGVNHQGEYAKQLKSQLKKENGLDFAKSWVSGSVEDQDLFNVGDLILETMVSYNPELESFINRYSAQQ